MTRMESDALSIISDGLSAVTEGCRLPVRMKNTEDWPKAEVISIRQVRGGLGLVERLSTMQADQ